MIKIEFLYNGNITQIESHIYDYMSNVCQKYASLINTPIEDLFFKYNEYEINKDLSLEENIYLSKENKIIDEVIKILVFNKKDKNLAGKDKNNNKIEKKEEYEKKINYKFKKNPNLKYKHDITDNNDFYGRNDVFEVFISYKDNSEYIVSKNFDNFNLDIFKLIENKKILSLKGHNNHITTIRYFINDKNKNEYLISADFNYYIIIWDITNNYNILHNFNSGYNGNIYSCLLVFPYYSDNNYFITSTRAIHYGTRVDQYTKLYSLNDGKFIKNYDLTDNIRIFYLLLWHNKFDDQYYVIQLSIGQILIYSLFGEDYFCLKNGNEDVILSGYIYEKNKIDYLCVSAFENIIIWDLFFKSKFKVISSLGNQLWHIIKWNDKYSIIPDRKNKSFKIIDMEQYKIISNIGGEHKNDILCVKKVFHPIYGESLLSCGEDKTIKLWTI